jgi:predicted ATPase
VSDYGYTGVADPTFITRVRLRSYKSIAVCDVNLGPLTFLVGRNGAGKSNVLDALRFVADSLRTTLDHALRERGGIAEVRRRSRGHPNHFGIKFNFALDEGISGSYSFRIGARPGGGFEVQQEDCTIGQAFFAVRSGVVEGCSFSVRPPAFRDRLYLVNAAGLEEFRPLYDALSRMGFYNLSPERIRDLQSPDPGEILNRDGSNIASVFANIASKSPGALDRIERYLGKVVPGIRGASRTVIGPKETLSFKQAVAGDVNPWDFYAANMSDGTLRAFGVLVSLFQSGNGHSSVRLVGIEEPESALHPAAGGMLLDALTEAAEHTQVIVTSHSPDLLNHPDITTESLLAVQAVEGNTLVGPVDEVGREALRKRLYTAGELLRQDQIQPDPEVVARAEARQMKLFDD